MNQTWRERSAWIEAHQTQDALIALYLILLYELDPASKALEDALLNACEIVDYALTEESVKKVEDAIDERCRVEDPERLKLRQAARARAQPLGTSDGGSESSTR